MARGHPAGKHVPDQRTVGQRYRRTASCTPDTNPTGAANWSGRILLTAHPNSTTMRYKALESERSQPTPKRRKDHCHATPDTARLAVAGADSSFLPTPGAAQSSQSGRCPAQRHAAPLSPAPVAPPIRASPAALPASSAACEWPAPRLPPAAAAAAAAAQRSAEIPHVFPSPAWPLTFFLLPRQSCLKGERPVLGRSGSGRAARCDRLRLCSVETPWFLRQRSVPPLVLPRVLELRVGGLRG
jgi:hypothetical protein